MQGYRLIKISRNLACLTFRGCMKNWQILWSTFAICYEYTASAITRQQLEGHARLECNP